MPTLIAQPTRIEAAGNKPKLIDEYIGRVNSANIAGERCSYAQPGRLGRAGPNPDFDEYTLVLKGILRVEHREGSVDVQAGQAVIAHKGEWIRYSTPEPGGAEYIAICVPGFSMDSVHRDAD